MLLKGLIEQEWGKTKLVVKINVLAPDFSDSHSHSTLWNFKLWVEETPLGILSRLEPYSEGSKSSAR